MTLRFITRVFLLISIILITVINCQTMKEEKCEPIFSDDCFQDVQRDLRNLVDFKNNLPRNVTLKSVQGFCVSMQDALDCCENVMDSKECKTDPRKASFTEWMFTFKTTFNHMCIDNNDHLMDIFLSINCWNIERFFQCSRSVTGISKVEDIFFKPLNRGECRNMTRGFKVCDKKAKVGSCREMEEVKSEVKDLIDFVLEKSHCINASTIGVGLNNGKVFVSNIINILILILSVVNAN